MYLEILQQIYGSALEKRADASTESQTSDTLSKYDVDRHTSDIVERYNKLQPEILNLASPPTMGSQSHVMEFDPSDTVELKLPPHMPNMLGQKPWHPHYSDTNFVKRRVDRSTGDVYRFVGAPKGGYYYKPKLSELGPIKRLEHYYNAAKRALRPYSNAVQYALDANRTGKWSSAEDGRLVREYLNRVRRLKPRQVFDRYVPKKKTIR